MLSKAHDTHLSQHSALPQHDIRWWNQENTTHTHTHDSASSNEGPVNTRCWWGQAFQTVTNSSVQSAVLYLHFHQGNPCWDDYKETYREHQAKCSNWKPQKHGIPSWHKSPRHPSASLQGLGHYWHLDPHPEMGSVRTYRTDSSWLLHSSQQKVSQLSWSLHTSWDLSSVVSKLSRLVTVRFSAAASFDSLGSFILSVQSAPMFSTSPLTFSVSTLAITYLLFLAERFLSESKSLFHSILERNPRRCLKGMSWNYM